MNTAKYFAHRVKEKLDYKLNPFAMRSNGDLPYDVSVVRSQLEKHAEVTLYQIDTQGFWTYLETTDTHYPSNYYSRPDGRRNEFFLEKALEHFVSLQLLAHLPKGIVIDVGSSDSPFAAIAQDFYDCTCYRFDLRFSHGIATTVDGVEEIRGDAAHMPVKNNSISALTLHCSFEMFEDDSDSGLIKEANRVLRPGGKLVILPLYMNELYHVFRDPKASTYGLKTTDKGARVVSRNDFHGVRFARFYDHAALLERVLANADGLSAEILLVENEKAVDSICYLKWILVMTKT